MRKQKRRNKVHRHDLLISVMNLIAAMLALLTSIIQLMDD